MIKGHVIIKRYQTDKVGYKEWYYKSNDSEGIHKRIMELTGNDIEVSAWVTSWCKKASVGEVYYLREGEVAKVLLDRVSSI